MPSSLSRRLPLFVALLAAWIATLGSLYFSEIAGFVPCKLCWVQRIFMYPLAAILLVAVIRRDDDDVPYYVLPLSLIGMGVSTYHYLLQKTDLFSESTVCSGGVPCSIDYINWLGFITIPFLALTAFVIITISMVFLLANRPVVATEEA